MAKEKMSLEKKTKLIYTLELAFFSVVFFVLATLEVLNIIGRKSVMLDIFNFVTAAGGTWMIVDFFWGLLSKKRRPKISLLDKALHLPAGIYLVAFDLFCIITRPEDPMIYRCGFPIAISYLCLCYIFEGIYHFYHPVPAILDAVMEVEEEPKDASKEESPVEETPMEEKENEEKQ